MKSICGEQKVIGGVGRGRELVGFGSQRVIKCLLFDGTVLSCYTDVFFLSFVCR